MLAIELRLTEQKHWTITFSHGLPDHVLPLTMVGYILRFSVLFMIYYFVFLSSYFGWTIRRMDKELSKYIKIQHLFLVFYQTRSGRWIPLGCRSPTCGRWLQWKHKFEHYIWGNNFVLLLMLKTKCKETWCGDQTFLSADIVKIRHLVSNHRLHALQCITVQ